MIGNIAAISAAMVLGMALAPVQPATPVSQMYQAVGMVSAIHCAGQEWYSIDVELTGCGMPYDGHVYTIDLSAGDMTDWIEEQGPVTVNDRVFVWMDSNGTNSVLDDRIEHINK